MTEMTLNILKAGERGVIQRLSDIAPQVRQRLLELGMTKGALVEFIRTAPMGDPIEVRIKGYRLSLRRMEAEAVFVVKEK
jgi:Fe2+ transport system protein FeoA